MLRDRKCNSPSHRAEDVLIPTLHAKEQVSNRRHRPPHECTQQMFDQFVTYMWCEQFQRVGPASHLLSGTTMNISSYWSSALGMNVMFSLSSTRLWQRGTRHPNDKHINGNSWRLFPDRGSSSLEANFQRWILAQCPSIRSRAALRNVYRRAVLVSPDVDFGRPSTSLTSNTRSWFN